MSYKRKHFGFFDCSILKSVSRLLPSLPRFSSSLAHLCFLTLFQIALFATFSLTLVSCSQAPKPGLSEQAPEEDYIYHKIKYSGETVAIISAWYTKSAKNWPEIVDSNPKLVPSRLRIGDLVRIPKRLVRRFKSLPQDFVSSFKAGVNQDPSKSASKDASEGEPVSVDTSNKNSRVEEPADNNYKDESIKDDSSKTDDIDSSANTNTVDSKVEEKQEVEVTEEEPAKAPVQEPKSEDVTNKGSDAAPENDENQKIRDQLMQELLQ